MLLKITPLYAGLLGLFFFVLSARVIRGRASTNTMLGDGGNAEMLRRIRGHANFAEYVPIVLVMMAMLEIGGLVAPLWLHLIGLCLLVGRVLHGIALSFTEQWVPGRLGGMILTFAALTASSLFCLWRGIAASVVPDLHSP